MWYWVVVFFLCVLNLDLQRTLSGKRGKNKIDLKLEEHIFIEEEDELIFDHHGHEIKFPFKLNSKTVENYPKRILEKNLQNIKKPEITNDLAIEKTSISTQKTCRNRCS